VSTDKTKGQEREEVEECQPSTLREQHTQELPEQQTERPQGNGLLAGIGHFWTISTRIGHFWTIVISTYLDELETW
jgi:hypothetical protein